jgi:Uma2 family endonuclease
MAILVTDPWLESRLLAERQAAGADLFDEAWEGVYLMPPLVNDEHQQIATRLGAVFQAVVGWPGRGEVRVAANVSDREEGWQGRFRVPDVAVFLAGGRARNCGTHWCGGPDFVAEVLSPGDATRTKMPSYSQLGVRELLVIDRDPWALELYRLEEGRLTEAGHASLDQPDELASAVLPLTFRLGPGEPRPCLEVAYHEARQVWKV